MSTGEDLATPVLADDAAEVKPKLALDVQISDVGPCKKHIKVSIPQADIENQFKTSLGEMVREAFIPGFRPGHAPRQLVERRYRKQVAGTVKQNLLLASLTQIDEDHKLNAITQPDFDVEAIELPTDGPMTFEMDVEVRPDFKLPAYKALTVKSPVRTVTEADVDAEVKTFCEQYAQVVPKLEGGAEVGDFVTADLAFHSNGASLNTAKEVNFRLQSELRFQDGTVPNTDQVLAGVRPGESREAEARIGSASADPALRGQSIGVTFHVLDLKYLRLPERTAAFFESVGFKDEADLREALHGVLGRRFDFQRRQVVRESILSQLVAETPFDLPADLVSRQEKSTLRRLALDLRQGGLSDNDIRAREAELRANAHESTLKSLKEFFILARIAEEEKIEVDDQDVEDEIEALAARSDESPRRVRARIEKDNLGEALASQILERKTIDRILEFVKLEKVEMAQDKGVATLDQAATTAPAPSAEPAAEAPGGESA